MKLFSKIYFISIVGFLGLTSCNKSFLDRLPQEDITPNVFFNTEDDLMLYTYGLLEMPNRNSYLNDQSTDNAATTAAVEIKTMMVGSPSSQTITSGWSWGRLRNINYFLDNYSKANVSDEIKNHYVGLARYYRAKFYYNMVKRYSDVPWYDKTLNKGDEGLKDPQTPRADVMDKILEDLDFASKNVRETVPTGTPGNWAVLFLQAKIALQEGSYRKYHDELNLKESANTFFQLAETASKAIIDSKKFAISNTKNPEKDYADLFESQDLSQNKEVILLNAFDQSKNISQNVNGVVFGDYEQSPSRDLLQSYLMKDGSRFTDKADYSKYGFVKEFENRDPRLKQTFVGPEWIRVPNNSPYIQRLNKNFSGYHQRKGFVNSTDQFLLNSVDFPVHRFAEVLLMYAEAKAELGTLTQGDLDLSINLLRDRVAMPHLNLVQANGNLDPKLVEDFPKVNGSHKGVILEIRRERRVELAFENSRYEDLMRWNAGKLLENIPEGMYFPGVGNFDLTGDGVPDIKLIPEGQTIPKDKEKNALGVNLVYYTIGKFDGTAGVYLKNGVNGGTMVTDIKKRTFIEPMYYYRPIPQAQMLLNDKLKQPFGWK